MLKSLKLTVLILACATLNACASGARPDMMTSVPSENYTISTNNKYYNAISIENISGGKETNPMLTSKVNNTAFKSALENSLAAYGILNESGKGKYILDAELLALEQPIIGFSFTVDSVVAYKMKKASNNSVVYNETIKAAGTAKMGDSLIGVERLKIANENSVRNNIDMFLDDIIK